MMTDTNKWKITDQYENEQKLTSDRKEETFESSVLRSIHDNLDDGTDTRVRQCVKEIVQLHDKQISKTLKLDK